MQQQRDHREIRKSMGWGASGVGIGEMNKSMEITGEWGNLVEADWQTPDVLHGTIQDLNKHQTRA